MVFNDTRWRNRQPRDGAGPDGPVLDMTPDGAFVEQRTSFTASPLAARVLGLSILVAVLAGLFAVALLALWLALQLIPIAIGAGLIAYGVFRFQAWRARASFGRHGHPVRRQPGG